MTVAVAVLIGVAAATVVYVIVIVVASSHILDDPEHPEDDNEYPAGFWGDE